MSLCFVCFLRSGGNGDLFKYRRTDTGEYVIVKFLREYKNADARKAFAREVRILTRNACGFVPVLQWNTDAECPYYVMPYFEKGPLTRYAGGLSDSQLHFVATELTGALACFHAGLCAHGDIKPDNVLVDEDGRLRVADPLGNGWGCSGLFPQNHGGGTPGYRAPEVSAGGPISKPGDIYSLGATLYHLLTGRAPYQGQPLDPTLEGYTNAPMVREVIAACCQFDPNARPTMNEAARVLGGKRWIDIQAEQRRRDWFVAACVIAVIGGILLLGNPFES